MHQKIVVVSGGRLGNAAFFQKKVQSLDSCLLIACDGGARHLAAAGLRPDILIGDMDSLPPLQLEDYQRQGITMMKHPAQKDDTDTALALDYAWSLKPQSVQIWGALGGRIDHTLANIHLLLKGKDNGIPTCLMDEYGETFIAGCQTELIDAVGCLVSLIALSCVVKGITLEGFQYLLSGEDLSMPESRGISNIVVSSPALICVESGDLLVVRYFQPDVFPEVV